MSFTKGVRVIAAYNVKIVRVNDGIGTTTYYVTFLDNVMEDVDENDLAEDEGGGWW